MLILWYNNDNFVQLANEMLLLTGSPGNRTQRSRRRGDCQRNLQRQRPPRILSGVGGGETFLTIVMCCWYYGDDKGMDFD